MTLATVQEEAEQFFGLQLKTTRNIDTAWWDGWYHGGLQYQIEHHLFPQLPRCAPPARPTILTSLSPLPSLCALFRRRAC
jgi:fatty acid desaturase